MINTGSYVEVTRLQAHVARLNSQLDLALEQNRALYAKTRKKYAKMKKDLTDALHKVAQLLDIADDNASDLPAEVCETVESETEKPPKAVKPASKSASAFVRQGIRKIKNLSRTRVNQTTIKTYGIALQNAADAEYEYVEMKDCAILLNKWYKARITSPSKVFRYNPVCIPGWICDIVTAYGKHVAAGDVTKFVAKFESWCDSISPDYNSYALPFEIYNIRNKPKEGDYTVQASFILSAILSNTPNIMPDSSYTLAASMDLTEYCTKAEQFAAENPSRVSMAASRDSRFIYPTYAPTLFTKSDDV